MLPELPGGCFVPVGTDRLRAAAGDGVAQVIMVAGMEDQAAFLGGAAGLLESITLDMDCGVALAAEVARAPAVRDAYGLWEAAGKLGPCGRELCRRTAGELERLAAGTTGSVAAQVVLLDAAGERMVGMYGRMAR
jgi:cobalt-precorrin-5B (C1)-methyltransferase